MALGTSRGGEWRLQKVTQVIFCQHLFLPKAKRSIDHYSTQSDILYIVGCHTFPYVTYVTLGTPHTCNMSYFDQCTWKLWKFLEILFRSFAKLFITYYTYSIVKCEFYSIVRGPGNQRVALHNNSNSVHWSTVKLRDFRFEDGTKELGRRGVDKPSAV